MDTWIAGTDLGDRSIGALRMAAWLERHTEGRARPRLIALHVLDERIRSLFREELARVAVRPAAVNTGIVFVRTDIKDRGNRVAVTGECVTKTQLGTVIENAAGVKVSTIEHLMAAFAALGVDNAIVELDGPEVPIMDGSSIQFVALIDRVGRKAQEATRCYIQILQPIEVVDGDKVARLVPADQFELAFDGETARALHDEDLEVDTDFCAMCGHDWCSMRISKEIAEFDSGKDPGSQPVRRAMPSPGVSDGGAQMLAQRRAAVPVVDCKHACHTEHTPDAEAHHQASRNPPRKKVVPGAPLANQPRRSQLDSPAAPQSG